MINKPLLAHLLLTVDAARMESRYATISILLTGHSRAAMSAAKSYQFRWLT